MAKDKKRSGEHSKKHVLSQEAIYVVTGLFLFIFAIMGIINRSGIIGNLIRYALIYVIGAMYMLPLVALAGFGLYLFFMRQKPKIKIGVFTAFFILLVIFSSILLSQGVASATDVFDYYNDLVDKFKGADFYINRAEVSKLGGGLVGHVVFYAFAKLLNVEGIIIICYLVIFASIFVILKPIIYRFINFVRLNISKSGILERKLRKASGNDDDDIPPEFSLDDFIINPNDLGPTPKGQAFKPLNDDNDNKPEPITRETSNDEQVVEPVTTPSQNINPQTNPNQRVYQNYNQSPQYTNYTHNQIFVNTSFPEQVANQFIERTQRQPVYQTYQEDVQEIPNIETPLIEQENPKPKQDEPSPSSDQGFSYKPIIEDIYQKDYIEEEPTPRVNETPKYTDPKIEVIETPPIKNVKVPSEPYINQGSKPVSENMDVKKDNSSQKLNYDSFVLNKEDEIKSSQNKDSNSNYSNYKLPRFDYLKSSNTTSAHDNHIYAKEKIDLLSEKLRELNVKAEVIDYTVGPTFTRIEIRPDPGVKVAQINSIKDDLMLGMAVSKMRMESPIPGKSAIGIEIPNEKRQMVRIKDILSTQSDFSDKVMIALGMDVEGNAIAVNVAKMPHLLIAGGSGSGKSVCINTIIISLLMKYSPEDLRLLLVDLKQVELSAYQDLPHLICPIINQARDAVIVLNRLVDEMEQRYDLLKKYQARDINQYNKFASFNQVKKMPYLIVVIDEFADLMTTSSKEVEFNVQRLSQLARAAGIHLIFATQRPSVDVISGVIKSNFLTRIAFRVFSAIDSKTIVERSGAEDLLGDGDMLYSNKGSLTRIQGAFVDDEEINRITSYIKSQTPPDYYENFVNLETNLVNQLENFADNNDDDSVYEKIKYYVMTKENGKATISEFQRRFGIGFARAGRMMDRLEDEGIVSSSNGANPRDVLKRNS